MNAIEREIESQPETWRQAAARARDAAGDLPARGDRLAVIGCGTSLFVAQALAVLREAAGHGEADAFPASEMPSGRGYDAVLAVSRSGTTTEVLRALQRLPDGVSTLAICAVADTPIERLVGHRVTLEFADEEAIVQTRFPTAVLALVRAHLGDGVDGVEAVARAGEDALAAALPEHLVEFERFVFLASGWGVGVAHEAGLKLREAAGVWSESYPAMEFRHGPVSATSSSTLVWALGPVDPDVLDAAVRAGATVVDHGRDPMA
ncbi:MAG: SIS domain-containing protein, partial [Actinomycetota bacterium]|nr:SIS domain-containing protein [Actinomycetota bacterium]